MLQFRLLGAAKWTSWSDAAEAVAESSLAFDTFEWQVGVDYLRPGWGVRAGFRQAELPFAVGQQPTEWDVTFGAGLVLGGGRGRLDVTIERGVRSTDVFEESMWNVVGGFTIRP